MAFEIVLPQWGMEMQDGVIVKWLKKEGDPVQEGEPIVEIETAKIQTELESTAPSSRVCRRESQAAVEMRARAPCLRAPSQGV